MLPLLNKVALPFFTFKKYDWIDASGEGQFFYLWVGEGHNVFVSVQGEGQNFLGALFKKLVVLSPAK